MTQHLYRSARCREQLPPEEQAEVGLLRAAVRHDPRDHASRERLVRALASRLQYTLHELPFGVLYGADGATPDQCLELEGELDEFCRLAEGSGLAATYRELVGRCRYHYRAYRDFLLGRNRFASYAEYLARRAGGGPS